MTSIDEVRALLNLVVDHTETARGHVETARARIADATALLTEAGAQHPTPLVPPALHRAATEVDRGLGLIGAGGAAVAAVGARL